jgi:hypothetical protein
MKLSPDEIPLPPKIHLYSVQSIQKTSVGHKFVTLFLLILVKNQLVHLQLTNNMTHVLTRSLD